MTTAASPTLEPAVRDWRAARAFMMTAVLGAVVFVIWGRLVDLNSTPFLIIIYIFIFPGLLGLGWLVLYALFLVHFDRKMTKDYLARAQRFLQEQSKVDRFEHCDIDIINGRADALAIRDDTLYVLRSGRFQAIPLQTVLQWQVSANEPTVIAKPENMRAMMDVEAFRTEERASLAKLTGVFLTTNDRNDPLVHIRLLDTETCNRWSAILQVVLK